MLVTNSIKNHKFEIIECKGRMTKILLSKWMYDKFTFVLLIIVHQCGRETTNWPINYLGPMPSSKDHMNQLNEAQHQEP